MLLFGGNNGALLDETWSWDGSNWMQGTPATPPFARQVAAMASDTARSRVVLFAGDPTDPWAWEWNGTQWSATNVRGPASRQATAMAYDPAHRQVVIFSGSGYTQDTWAWRTALPATFAAYGSGCPGSAGVPVLANAPYSLPWLGDTFTTRASGLAASSAAVLFATGLTATTPVDLGPYGMPGCSGLVAVAAVDFRTAAIGAAQWSLSIPNTAALNGAIAFQQAFVLEPGANATGVIATNGGAIVAGIR
jgi:hypothetical protein